jgi:hypothetical protein
MINRAMGISIAGTSHITLNGIYLHRTLVIIKAQKREQGIEVANNTEPQRK